MRKKLFFLLLILIMPMCLLLTGCDVDEGNIQTDARFVEVYDVRIDHQEYAEILVDKETRVMYLFVDGYKAGGLTVMLDTDGKPLLYDGVLPS